MIDESTIGRMNVTDPFSTLSTHFYSHTNRVNGTPVIFRDILHSFFHAILHSSCQVAWKNFAMTSPGNQTETSKPGNASKRPMR